MLIYAKHDTGKPSLLSQTKSTPSCCVCNRRTGSPCRVWARIYQPFLQCTRGSVVLPFSLTTLLQQDLTRAWQHSVDAQAYQDSIQDFPAQDIFTLLREGLTTNTPYLIHPLLLVVLDTVFFSRADSTYCIYSEDLWINTYFLLFRDQRFNGKSIYALQFRLRAYDSGEF